MNHETVQALIPAYAIHATDAEETAGVEAHLFRCPSCRQLLAQYRQLNDDLLYTVPPHVAPPRLETRVRARLPRRSRRPARRFLLWAVGAIVLLFLALLSRQQQTILHQEDIVQAQATALALSAQGRALPIRADAAPEVTGAVYVRRDIAVAVLHVSHLPPPPSGHVYQVWLIRGDERQSGGLFRPDPSGQATVVIRAPQPLGTYQAIGVTVEPAGGSPAPTSPRVFGVPITSVQG